MARRSKRIAITAEGRDRGKTFEIREVPADQGERWANRALIALMNAGTRLPEGALDGGMAGLDLTLRNIILTGMQALSGLRFAEIEPLLDEMKPCISWVPPGNAPIQQIFSGEDSQIEEISTWWTLRFELLQLHLGFSVTVGGSTSASAPSTPPV